MEKFYLHFLLMKTATGIHRLWTWSIKSNLLKKNGTDEMRS